MAELKDAVSAFRQHKLLLTKSYRKLHRYIVEQCIESLESHRTYMIGLFKDIVIDCHRDKLMTSLLNYFRDEEPEYLHYLQVLDSAVVNLSRSIPPVWEPYQGLIRPNPPVAPSFPEHIPASEYEITKLLQKEQSKCMDDHEHIPSHKVVSVLPVSPTCPEHILESEVTNLLQKEQSMCMDHEHILSSEVILDSSVSLSTPEICSEPHISNYHHQQTVNVSQCSMELQDDHIVMFLHDIPTGDSETLLKQVSPCPISAQSLATVQIMCLKYNASDPPYIDTVNDSGMLVGQNLPGG